MNTVEVCIFEDVRFGIEWDIPKAFKCDHRRQRVEREWTFHLHETFCPENEENNPNALTMDTADAYQKAHTFVSSKFKGFGCFFFDCQFVLKSNGTNLRLSDEQLKELAEFGTDKIEAFAFPGMYLALRAAKNLNWRGLISIASTAANLKKFEHFINRLREIDRHKRILLLPHSLADCGDVDELQRNCQIGLDQFLQFVASPKDRLHPPGTEAWFDNDYDHEKGHPPHRWNAFANLPPDSPARKALVSYLANLFGSAESEAAKWIQRTHQANLHGQLKCSLGAVARAHGAKHTIRGPTLFTVLLAVAACCPNPMAWIQNVSARLTDHIFHYDCSPEDAKRLLYMLIAENGLFQRIFVWDGEHCPNRDKCEPVIVDVQIVSDCLTIKLDSDFNVSRLASRSGTTKKCLNDMNEELQKGGHPLSIFLDETNNAIVFETKAKA